MGKRKTITMTGSRVIKLNSGKLEECRAQAKTLQTNAKSINERLKKVSKKLETDSANLKKDLSNSKTFSVDVAAKRIEIQSVQIEMLGTIIAGAADQAKGKTGALADAISKASRSITNINKKVDSIKNSSIGATTGIKSMSTAWSDIKKAWTQMNSNVQTAKGLRIAKGDINKNYSWDARKSGKADIWLVTQTDYKKIKGKKTSTKNPEFDASIWPPTTSTTKCDPSTLCDLAAASMALSCLGYRVTPKELAAINERNEYYAQWEKAANAASAASAKARADGTQKTKIWYENTKAGITAKMGLDSLENCLANYLSDPDTYAAPIVHMPNATKNGHWVMIVGKNADGSFSVVDPSQGTYGNNCTKLNVVLKKSDACGTNKPVYTSTVDQVVQFYKK